MPRLLFSKTGEAVWISHLDTMRLLQRAFKRCGFRLKHTQGFNPRPSVSIAMPLSVGVESQCELLDFDLEDQGITCQEIMEQMNRYLIPGIQVHSVYEDGLKLKNLKYLQCCVRMEYDNGVPEGSETRLHALFSSPEIYVEKKSKSGITEQNIAPMIRNIGISRLDDDTLNLEAVVSCQEPNLNPAQLTAAIAKYLPECYPDFYKCRRVELLTSDGQLFR